MRRTLASHGSRKLRLSRCSCVTLCTALLALAALVGPACALTLVVAPDGSGDFTSVQAGFDSLARAPMTPGPDTLLVRPGDYAEDVIPAAISLDGIEVIASGGPGSAWVRRWSYPANGTTRCVRVDGLSIREAVVTASDLPIMFWANCRFEGGVVWNGDMNSLYRFGPAFQNCEFRGRSRLAGCGGYTRGLRFVGGPVEIWSSTNGGVVYEDCSFEGPADTLVVAAPLAQCEVWFNRCSFSGAGKGVVLHSRDTYVDDLLYITNCRFESIDSVAIEGTPQAYPPTSTHTTQVRLNVWDSRFSNCGTAVSWSGVLGSCALARDTIEACASDVVRIRGQRIGITDLLVLGGAAGGLRVESIPAPPGAPIYPYSLALTGVVVRDVAGPGIVVRDSLGLLDGLPAQVSGCHVEDAGGVGMEIAARDADVTNCLLVSSGGDGLRLSPQGGTARFSTSNITSVSNSGDGIRFVGPWTNATRVFQHNLVARNAGAGIRVGSPFVGSVAFNDAWQNYLGDYAQVDSPLDSNLVADPLFCSLATGDLTLQLGSPCGVGGPYGLIGALPETCPTIVGAPAAGRALIFAIHPNPARGEVLFTPPASGGSGTLDIVDVAGRRVWSQSFRAGGAPICWRGETSAGRAGAGLYWVRVTRAEGVTSRRLVWLN